MIENTNTKQFYPGPILNNTLEITDFLFNDAEQIKVKHSKLNEEGVLIDIDLNYPTDYEVTKILPSDVNAAEAALTASTGQVTLKNVNVLAGEKLTVYRVSQIIQDVDYPRTGAFPAASHEGALDYLTMQNQEQSEEIARSLKVPISTPNFNAAVPIPLSNRILRINDEASGFEFVPYDLDERLNTFEDTVVDNITAGQEAIKNSFEEFKNETNITIGNIDNKVTNAVDIANTANTKSDEAINIANTASTTATNAVTTSNSAITSADTAIATANSADIKSDEALLISQEAKEASLTAEANATTAKDKVDIFEQDIETVIAAADKIAQLEGAVDTAVQASENATKAAEDATQAAENAIASLDSKLDIDGTAVKATADANGNIITETYRTIADSYDTNDVDILLNNKADRNFSNLTEEAEKHFLNKSQITNCLLEVPQRIKLELNDGVVTLKAGSVVIVPNGFEADGITPKFDYVYIESDKTSTNNSAQRRMICYNATSSGLTNIDIRNCTSGATSPATSWSLWYDTTNNKVKKFENDATTPINDRISLPITICTTTTEGYQSIDQVFNGMGYIGSTVWVDKGVKGLIPNGRNADGTLRNIEYTTEKLATSDYLGVATLWNLYITSQYGAFTGCPSNYYYVQETQPGIISQTQIWYKPSENMHYFSYWENTSTFDVQPIFNVCDVVWSDAKTITSFQPKLPFRVVDTSSLAECAVIIDSYVNGTSWYRVYSDGWCEQGANVNFASGANQLVFLKQFINTQYFIEFSRRASATATSSIAVFTRNRTTTSCEVYAAAATACNWYACGYLAKGEY